MKEDINALDEIHKGACMGIDALDFIMEKVEDDALKKELENEYNNYKKIALEIEGVYPKYNEGRPHETSMMNKAMTWGSTQMKTMNDTSNSNIAEYIISGVNMGIIEGRKILNKKEIDEEVSNIVSKYVTMQEKSLDNLKNFL